MDLIKKYLNEGSSYVGLHKISSRIKKEKDIADYNPNELKKEIRMAVNNFFDTKKGEDKLIRIIRTIGGKDLYNEFDKWIDTVYKDLKKWEKRFLDGVK